MYAQPKLDTAQTSTKIIYFFADMVFDDAI